jgi:hypothetical protein
MMDVRIQRAVGGGMFIGVSFALGMGYFMDSWGSGMGMALGFTIINLVYGKKK